MRRFISGTLSAFKYLLALFMMYAGIATMLLPVDYEGGDYGWIYSSRISLVVVGGLFFSSGALLFFAKLFKRRRLVGYGLMSVYLCFVFAAILNALSGEIVDGVPNFLFSFLVGGLYLRWKYYLYYYPGRVDSPSDP